MSDEYEFYQGVVLRQIIVNSDYSMMFRPFLREGRINAFVINGNIGVFIKHSSKRMAPWRFSFNLHQVSDLLDLEAAAFDLYVVFVCGDDGLVTLDVASLHQIVSFEDTENAWVSIDRRPRSQYGVAGNRAELPNKVPNGTSPIHDLIRNRVGARRAS